MPDVATVDPAAIPGIDPEMAAALTENLRRQPEGLGDVTRLPIAEVRARYAAGRAWWNADGPAMAHTFDRAVDGPHGAIPVRFYFPAEPTATPLPCLVWLHGGGFVYGSIATHDRICRWLARRSGAVVCSVDYRLAPEHRFPTPLDETRAVLDFLAAEGPGMGIDAERIGVGGDSAGASIAVGVAMELRESAPAFLKHLVLFYGNHGLGPDSASAQRFSGAEYGLPPDVRRFFRAAYLRDERDWADPRVAQLSADLSGLPPAFIGVAELDPLADNGPALAARLWSQGVRASLTVYPGVLHGFLHMTRTVAKSRTALDEAGDAFAAAMAAA